MRISTKPFQLRLLLWVFPLIIGMLLYFNLTSESTLTYAIGGGFLMIWVLLYFLLPNVVELSLNDQSVSIRSSKGTIVEPIANIKTFTEEFAFINQNLSTWSFYSLTLLKPNLGRTKFFFLTLKDSANGRGAHEYLGELNYKIAVERKKRNTNYYKYD